MAKEMKKVADIEIGEIRTISVMLVEKHETTSTWTLVWSDGVTQELDKVNDPSIEVGT